MEKKMSWKSNNFACTYEKTLPRLHNTQSN